MFYEGQKGQERLIRHELPNGNKEIYEGQKGQERLIRKECPNGNKEIYEGQKGHERLVRAEQLMKLGSFTIRKLADDTLHFKSSTQECFLKEEDGELNLFSSKRKLDAINTYEESNSKKTKNENKN